jgi:hypothetical protein
MPVSYMIVNITVYTLHIIKQFVVCIISPYRDKHRDLPAYATTFVKTSVVKKATVGTAFGTPAGLNPSANN